MNNDYRWEQFNNFGYIKKEFTASQLKPLHDEVNEIQRNFEAYNKANTSLAGHIKKEFFIEKAKQTVETLVLPYAIAYDQQFNYTSEIAILDKDAPLTLDTCWVNFQKKHEFNPIHKHTGMYSFVIWLKIPYDFAEEAKVFPDTNGLRNLNGHFQFVSVRTNGSLLPYTVEAKENTMLFFPASMHHCVYPFYTSDEYRISVSGNFKCKANFEKP